MSVLAHSDGSGDRMYWRRASSLSRAKAVRRQRSAPHSSSQSRRCAYSHHSAIVSRETRPLSGRAAISTSSSHEMAPASRISSVKTGSRKRSQSRRARGSDRCLACSTAVAFARRRTLRRTRLPASTPLLSAASVRPSPFTQAIVASASDSQLRDSDPSDVCTSVHIPAPRTLPTPPQKPQKPRKSRAFCKRSVGWGI